MSYEESVTSGADEDGEWSLVQEGTDKELFLTGFQAEGHVNEPIIYRTRGIMRLCR